MEPRVRAEAVHDGHLSDLSWHTRRLLHGDHVGACDRPALPVFRTRKVLQGKSCHMQRASSWLVTDQVCISLLGQ